MKSKKITIEQFAEYDKIIFYSIRYDAEKNSEFEKFMLNFKDSPKLKSEYDVIIYWLKKISESGALERNFKPESKFNDDVWAIPIPLPNRPCRLRLYCIRISDEIVIIGNGGLKQTKKYNADPVLNECVVTLSKLCNLMNAEIKSGNLSINGKTLSGNLSFII